MPLSPDPLRESLLRVLYCDMIEWITQKDALASLGFQARYAELYPFGASRAEERETWPVDAERVAP